MSIISNLTGGVLLTGSFTTGSLLSGELVSPPAEGSVSLQYQWWVGDKRLPGARSSALWLDDQLVGQSIYLKVSYLDSQGQIQALSSDPVSPIASVLSSAPSYAWRGQTYFWKQLPARTGEWAVPKGHALLSQVSFSDASSLEKSGQTAGDGSFYLSNVAANATLKLQKSTTLSDTSTTLSADVKSAITLSDVLEALKLYLRKPIPEPSSFKTIAADVNQDGAVTLSDVLTVLKIYLGKPTAERPLWVFVDESADLSTVSTIQTKVSAPTADAHPAKLSTNFAAVLLGDVNGSWQPPVNQTYETLPPDHFTVTEIGLVGVSDVTLQARFGLT